MKTIYAASTPLGQAALAIIRISGPDAPRAAERLTDTPLPPPRKASLRRFHHPDSKELIDQGLLLYFPAPHSFTAEDTIELHLHGSPAVVAAMLEALGCMPDLEPARAGDFTRQAFTNGHLNLVEVEALADLIAAETEMQRKQAWSGLQGGLRDLSDDWHQRLIACLAQMEAVIEFPEDDNLAAPTAAQTPRHTLQALLADVDAQLRDARRGERIRSGIEIAIVGLPNVGKSSLFNALVGRERVLVSPLPGTTRDIIEARLDLGGYPITLIDMAGLRESADAIEAEGVARAKARALEADMRLVVIAPELNDDELRSSLSWLKSGDILALNKSDLGKTTTLNMDAPISVSAHTGAGLPALTDALLATARGREGREHGLITRARHRDVIARFRAGLAESLGELDAAVPDMELAAEALRQAGKSLSHLCAPLDVEVVLESLFSEFCIGK